MTTTTITRRVANGAVALSLAFGAAAGLAACGSDDISQDKFTSDLVDQGVDETIAECITDELYAQYEQSEINDIAEAEDAEDVDEGFAAISAECNGLTVEEDPAAAEEGEG